MIQLKKILRKRDDGFSAHLKLVRIAAGCFTMGSPRSEPGRWEQEVRHEVVISRSLLVCMTPVTQKIWTRLMSCNPSEFEGVDLPVEKVPWFGAVEFCNRLSELEGLIPSYTSCKDEVTWNREATGYRLPTEAEWEYACRAGSTTAYNTGAREADLRRAGWYVDNASNRTHPVKKKKPNAWGLYDMHGNVFEWCWDWRGDYSSDKVTDPVGPSVGIHRVFRGGHWNFGARECRSASRHYNHPNSQCHNIGFRPVRWAP